MRVFAPGRVNLIGDHTDYTGGLVLPMAIDLGTTIVGERGGDAVVLRSDACGGIAEIPVAVSDPASARPEWARYVAGVVAELRPRQGFVGNITTTLPLGAGLSSSASLEVAVALAVGDERDPLRVARLCQRAEHRGAGVPCGIMDQLVVAAGVEGHALLIDCHSLEQRAVRIPDDVSIYAVHCGEPRRLMGSAYAERRADCAAAEAIVGPLRDASIDLVEQIPDERVRRRARHVVSENGRVRSFAAAIERGDYGRAGALMGESHRSLRDDFAVSTTALDQLVDRLCATPGVVGARLTGAGFGGCVVVLATPAAEVTGWHLRPSAAARVSGEVLR
ncbi:MAG TPA: galactokinase [Acidimicrobiales bacterium]|nr:galactokinase [Acidimicrobiales bacterium]